MGMFSWSIKTTAQNFSIMIQLAVKGKSLLEKKTIYDCVHFTKIFVNMIHMQIKLNIKCCILRNLFGYKNRLKTQTSFCYEYLWLLITADNIIIVIPIASTAIVPTTK